MKSLSTSEKLWEIQMIKDLKAQYCRLVDTKSWELFEKLFAEDAHIRFYDVQGMLISSFPDARSFAEACRILDSGVSIHHIHNAEVSIESAEKASAIFSMEDQIYFPKGQGPYQSHIGYGFYHNSYVKKNGIWKIKSLELKRLKMDIS